jgi:4-amino-4-deoxy-L-arabinose transferase-like glycosyltransferase
MILFKTLNRFFRSEKAIYGILLAFFLLQSLFIFAPFVNLEYVYGTVSQKIIEHGFSSDIIYTQYYFDQISNPLFTSFMAIPFVALLGFSEFVVRLPVLLLSVFFLLICYRFVATFFDRKMALLSVLIVALNPLFWIFSNKIFTDAPFTVLVSLSIMGFIYSLIRKSDSFTILSALCLSLAFITKLIASLVYPLLGIILILYLYRRKGLNFWCVLKSFFICFVPYLIFLLVIVIPYFALMLKNFGFIMNPVFVTMVFEEGIIAPFVTRVLGYVVWLGIFVALFFPFVLFDFHRNIKKRFKRSSMHIWSVYILILVLNIIVIYLTRIKLHDMGEMDFGGLDVLLPFPEHNLLPIYDPSDVYCNRKNNNHEITLCWPRYGYRKNEEEKPYKKALPQEIASTP